MGLVWGMGKDEAEFVEKEEKVDQNLFHDTENQSSFPFTVPLPVPSYQQQLPQQFFTSS